HLKMCVAGPSGRPLETIWWNGAEQTFAIQNGIDMAYTIEAGKWNGETFLQLSVQDMRKGEQSAISSQQSAVSNQQSAVSGKQ
ncbi:MAG TPA: hypothetical protein VMS31_03260, partial [Pyrinomonadaceae bacterium]|nr:hypothetical protein [Pyrinomonadaceae bacterium]